MAKGMAASRSTAKQPMPSISRRARARGSGAETRSAAQSPALTANGMTLAWGATSNKRTYSAKR